MRKLVLVAVLVTGGVAGASVPTHAGSDAMRQNPLGSLSRTEADRSSLRGRVQARLSAGAYTYLELQTERDRRRWTVTLGSGAPTGALVRVRSIGVAHDFHSRRLARTFPELTFGIVTRLD